MADEKLKGKVHPSFPPKGQEKKAHEGSQSQVPPKGGNPKGGSFSDTDQDQM
jgi:hypothetical protein